MEQAHNLLSPNTPEVFSTYYQLLRSFLWASSHDVQIRQRASDFSQVLS